MTCCAGFAGNRSSLLNHFPGQVLARTLAGALLAALLLLLAARPAQGQAEDHQEDSETREYLDVSISIFDQNLPEDPRVQQQQGIYAPIRAAEAHYFPAYLRELMENSGRWGAVRLRPQAEPGAELMIEGRIIHSDGQALALHIEATDSSGRRWLDQRYTGTARESVSLQQPTPAGDPFQHVFDAILADLAAVHRQLPPAEISRIKTLSFLRYAAALSPATFADYLQRNEQGYFEFSRLPAANDPMLQRVEEIRRHEYLFIDVVDEQYQDYFTRIKPVYDLWRDYRREQLFNATTHIERESSSNSGFRRGSYRALRESYDNYRWARLQDQYLDEIATGFSNEIAPTRLRLDDTLYNLSGTIEEQYREWRAILRRLYELEGASG